jgi:uroporphyrinogen-III synthase
MLPTLFLTRPHPQSEDFAAMCRQAIGVEVPVVISPLIKIVPRHVPLHSADFGDVILTSANGARALADLCDVTGRTAYCVGDQTAEIATKLGMHAVSAHGAAADLIELIKRSDPKQPLLHARGQETRGDIAQILRSVGYEVLSEVLYAQEPCDLSAEAKALLCAENIIAAPLFSPRSAQLLSAAASKSLAKIVVFPLSAAVAQAYSGPKSQQMRPPTAPNASTLCDLITAFYLASSG